MNFIFSDVYYLKYLCEVNQMHFEASDRSIRLYLKMYGLAVALLSDSLAKSVKVWFHPPPC